MNSMATSLEKSVMRILSAENSRLHNFLFCYGVINLFLLLLFCSVEADIATIVQQGNVDLVSLESFDFQPVIIYME